MFHSRTFYSLIMLVLISPVIVHAQTVPADTFKAIQTQLNARQYDEVMTKVEELLKSTDLTPKDRQKLHYLAADALMRKRPLASGLPVAITHYQSVVEDGTQDNASRVDALKLLANAQLLTQAGRDLKDMSIAPAIETLKNGLTLPDLLAADRLNALFNIADLYTRADDHAAARQILDQAVSLDVNDALKSQAWQRIGIGYAKEGDVNKAEAVFKEHNLNLIDLYRATGEEDKLTQVCEAIMAQADLPAHKHWSAFMSMPVWDWRNKDVQSWQTLCQKYMPAFIAADPNRAVSLYNKFTSMSSQADISFVEWAAKQMLAAPRLTPAQSKQVYKLLLDALAQAGNTEEAHKVALACATDEKADAAAQYWATLVAAGFSKDASVKALQVAVNTKTTLDAKSKAGVILEVGQLYLRADREALGREMLSLHQQMIAKWPLATIDCQVMDQAPGDVTAWLNSPMVKQNKNAAVLNRPYGDNLQFLVETDSAMTGRTAVAQATTLDDDSRTVFHAAADASGIHLFFMSYDTKAVDVISQQVRGGGFEMYMATGVHEPYWVMLGNLPEGDFDPAIFPTMYNNAHFKLPTKNEGTFRSQTMPVKDGFATYMFFDWSLFFDKLPATGDSWEFEAIRWTRSGGFSFAGSQSVHNRSSWGKLVFTDMTPAHLTAIRKRLVYKAASKFRSELPVKGSVGGWNDNQLGDVDFYNKMLVPRIKLLSNELTRVTADMSDQTANDLFEHVVYDWMTLDQQTKRLRAQNRMDALFAK